MDEEEEVDIVGGLDNFMTKNEREMWIKNFQWNFE